MNEQIKKRTISCVVKSAKMDKSRVGLFVTRKKEPLFGKIMTKRTRVMFHDEKNLSSEGDQVLLAPCSPLSNKKSYELVEVVKKARG